eukprot:5137852-Prymnesium_polylepis.1
MDRAPCSRSASNIFIRGRGRSCSPRNGRVGHEGLARMVMDDPGKPSKIKADHAMEFIKTSRHPRVNGSTPVKELHQRENG